MEVYRVIPHGMEYRGIKIFCTVKWYLLTDLTLRLRGLQRGVITVMSEEVHGIQCQ